MCNKHRIGTWNIRSMLQLGKVQLLGEEITRLGVDICGLSEVRWDGQGHFTILDGHTIVYSERPTQGMSGVAVWIHRKIAGALVGYQPVSDRVLVVRLNVKPRNITLIQRQQPRMKKWRGSTKTCLKQLNMSPRGTCCSYRATSTPKSAEESHL